MSYNIQYGGKDLSMIGSAIEAASPDLVGLQEVDVHWSARSQFVDQATALGQRLGMQVRFAPIYTLPPLTGDVPRQFGVAVLSKHPITSWRNLPLTRLSTQEPNAAPAPAPGLLEAMIEVQGRAIRVLNTHLDYRADPAVRRQQVAEMIHHIDESNGPTIVFGDMNAPPEAPELQPLFVRLHDARPDAPPGFTYPADLPVKRIDYIMTTAHFGVRSSTVGASTASDHRPLVVQLVVQR